MTVYVYCRRRKKVVPKAEADRPRRRSGEVVEDIRPFVSMVDGSLISSRSDLREHNIRNDVVCAGDLKREDFARRPEFAPVTEGAGKAIYDTLTEHGIGID